MEGDWGRSRQSRQREIARKREGGEFLPGACLADGFTDANNDPSPGKTRWAAWTCKDVDTFTSAFMMHPFVFA